MADVTKVTYLRSDEVDLDGVSPTLRFSQLALSPGADFFDVGWTYRGVIMFTVLSGNGVVATHLDESGGTSEFMKGTKNAVIDPLNPETHDWAQVFNPPSEVPVAVGDAVMFKNNFRHGFRNTGATEATLLVVSAIAEDQCGGRPCFTYP